MLNRSPAIIVIAYNRPHSLDRLLNSLSKAYYHENNIPLIISIDKSDNLEVLKIAQNYEWCYGPKKVIVHKTRLGLKEHVLFCNDLSIEYSCVIILEDDLFVSPYFYDYAQKASEYYLEDENIAGISLYNHSFNEVAKLPFYPINDGSDVYFLQIASSWGQLSWGNKWKKFKDWYNIRKNLKDINGLPEEFIKWPESSWKKYFIGYLVDTNKYFVYPNISLTTNFSDEGGQNIRESTSIYQVPILMGEKKWIFKKFSESDINYDAYCEINPEYLKKNNGELMSYNFEVDLYGTKPLNMIKTKFLITSKPSRKTILKFGLKFKTLPLNISYNIKGLFFTLTDKNNCYDSLLSIIKRKIEYFVYFYRDTSIKMYILLIINKLMRKN